MCVCACVCVCVCVCVCERESVCVSVCESIGRSDYRALVQYILCMNHKTSIR